MPTGPRPYGRGPYGVGPYSRWGPSVWDVGGASSLSFGVQAAPTRVFVFEGVTAIAFLPSAMAGIVHPAEALTGIVFDARARLIPSWQPPAPCEGGAWQDVNCATGGWAPVAAGTPGSWVKAR